MTTGYFQTLFGDAARHLQEQAGSRESYARMEARGGEGADAFTEKEIAFLERRDSFYMASVTADGWPYVQHRGGQAGFVKIVGPQRIAFADYPGNRQYISLGNLATDDRVALFFMDYPARRRLKLIGHAKKVATQEAMIAPGQIEASGGADQALIVDVVGFDWNCPQYITQRFSLAEIGPEIGTLRDENAMLRAELARLRREKQ